MQSLEALLKQHEDSDLVRFNVRQNHAPMVMIAMYRMGAGEDQLRRYYANLRVEPVEPGSQQPLQINPDNWMEYLGNFDALGSYCRFFHSEIRRLGTDAVLHLYVSSLLAGVTAHAFHPLLRLGYGIDLDHDGEIALGLGYWAATYLRGPEMPAGKPDIAPGELLEALADVPSLREIKPESRSIAGRIHQFYSKPDFRNLLQPIRFDPENPLKEISSTISKAFVENHHFTMLHGVTGCYALRLVLPYCQDQHKAISEYWYSICAAYLTVINVAGDKRCPLPDSDDDWPSIQKQALETGVEHSIKLTYACFKEWEHYRRDVYRRLALRDIAIPAPFY